MIESGIKLRKFPKNNYRAIYVNGKTLRQRYDVSKPITDLDFPEFYDVKITNKCNSKCGFCYMDSTPMDEHYLNASEKILDYFGCMDENQRPFQVAIGGGEPTLHPGFESILKTFYDLGITPNYTTNGMHVSDELIEMTKKYCGGVAISCHDHLESYWRKAIEAFQIERIKLNLHIIISDKESVDKFINIFNEYNDKVDYFVMLPHTERGRAEKKTIEYEYLFEKNEKLNTKKIAYGALFHPYLIDKKNDFKLSLYEPEIMSKYLDLKDMKLYLNSFSDVEVNRKGESNVL